jgi:hypothetical protein
VHRWSPPAGISRDLPPGFSFELKSVVLADGLRWFFPLDWYTHRRRAWLGGLALRIRRQGLPAGARNWLRLQWFLHRRAVGSREHLGNNFLRSGSWRICRRGREGEAARPAVLPETLGLAETGRGKGWDAQRLLAEGRQEAESHGIEGPTEAECLQYGLWRAASLQPLPLPEDRVPRLVRDALYLRPGADPVPYPDRRLLLGRLSEAFYNHLRDSPERFSAWFWGAKSSLPGQLAKKTLSSGVSWPQASVRRTLLDLGWEAYAPVARCMDEMLRTFRDMIPEPLSPRERRLFDQMHLSRRHFGGLPFALIAERAPVLTPAVFHLWEHPEDPQAVPVLHRILYTYAEMAATRRAADRVVKAKKATGLGGRLTNENVPLDMLTDRTSRTSSEGLGGPFPPAGRQALDEFMEKLRLAKKIRCACPKPVWHGAVDDVKPGEQIVVFTYRSTCCGRKKDVKASLSDVSRFLLRGA